MKNSTRIAIICGMAAMMIMPTYTAPAQAAPKTKTSVSAKTRNLSVAQLFERNVGNYPMDFNMFANKQLCNRLTRLLGQSRFNTLKKYFQTQTPIEKTDWSYEVTGGESHNMGENYFIIYYNGRTDKLSVEYNFKGNHLELSE